MKRSYWLATLMVLVIATTAAQADSTAWSASTLGVGANGWDWIIGTWSCTNSLPSPMGGPSTMTLTFTRSNASGSLFARSTGQNFDSSGYIAYASSTKTWLNPSTYSDGSYNTESTTDTGKTTVWSGMFFNAASGKSIGVRDTYVALSATKFHDLGEYQDAGTWKTQTNVFCTKT
jgi:hypothetical protein